MYNFLNKKMEHGIHWSFGQENDCCGNVVYYHNYCKKEFPKKELIDRFGSDLWETVEHVQILEDDTLFYMNDHTSFLHML